VKIGLLNYNFVGWKKFGFFIDPFAAGPYRPGVNHGIQKKVIREINRVKQDVDFLIVILHIGNVLHTKLSKKDNKFITSLKADLIIVHHPHIAQVIDSDNVFSLGDFMFLGLNSLQNRESKILICSPNEKPNVIGIKINDGLPVI
jgi:hypothetical protein